MTGDVLNDGADIPVPENPTFEWEDQDEEGPDDDDGTFDDDLYVADTSGSFNYVALADNECSEWQQFPSLASETLS